MLQHWPFVCPIDHWNSIWRQDGETSALGRQLQKKTVEQWDRNGKPRKAGKGKTVGTVRNKIQISTNSALSTVHPFEELNVQIKSNWITHYRIKLVIGVGLIQWSTNSSAILLDHLPANLFCLSLFVHFFFYSIYLTCKITDSHFNSTHIQTCTCIALQVSLFFFFW